MCMILIRCLFKRGCMLYLYYSPPRESCWPPTSHPQNAFWSYPPLLNQRSHYDNYHRCSQGRTINVWLLKYFSAIQNQLVTCKCLDYISPHCMDITAHTITCTEVDYFILKKEVDLNVLYKTSVLLKVYFSHALFQFTIFLNSLHILS